MTRRIVGVGIVAALISLALASVSSAAEPVKIGIVSELTGSGATAGIRFQRGVLMAMDDINAKGGMLGRQVEQFSLDTRTEPAVSVAAMMKAVEQKPFVVMGTVYSGSTIVNMKVLERAGIPQITASGAPEITEQGNLNIFRMELNSALEMKETAKWLTDVLKTKKLAILYSSDAMGKGLRDALVELLKPQGVQIVADVTSEVGQSDFTGELARIKASGADTFFLYVHEEETGRVFRQAREIGLNKMMRFVGSSTLLTANVLRLAGDAADGALAHVGLTNTSPAIMPVAARYEKKYQEQPDHNFMKGYIGLQIANAVVEETKSFDQQKFRDFLHNRTLCVKKHPGILLDVHYDGKGDFDRDTFIITTKNGKQVLQGTLPALEPALLAECK